MLYVELKENKRRKFLYKQGNFFILYGGYGNSKFTLALGPNGIIFLGMLIFALAVIYSSIICDSFKESSTLMKTAFCVAHSIFLYFFCRVGMTDPGIVLPTEKNALSESDHLEKMDYSYCSICQLYRPKGAHHCSMCGVCIKGFDHHCVFMGQCIGEKTVFSFYAMIPALMVCYVFHMYLQTPFVQFYVNLMKRFWSYIFAFFFYPC